MAAIQYESRMLAQLDHLEAACCHASMNRFEPHLHDYVVIQRVDRGVIAFEYDTHTRIAGAGSVIVIPAGVVHTGRPRGAEPISYRSLYPRVELLEKFGVTLHLREWRRTSVIAHLPLTNLFDRAHALCWRSSDSLSCQEALAELLCGCAGMESNCGTLVGGTSPRIDRARRSMDACPEQAHRLDGLASIAGISPFHFVRCFRAEVGLTPHQYLLNLRVHRARELMARGRAIAHAANEAGFADQSHLNRHFKRVLGTTPGRLQRDWLNSSPVARSTSAGAFWT